MSRIVFLLEEASMKVLLDNLLPRLFPELRCEKDFVCVKHDGKKDLEKSLPRKLEAWREPGVRFCVILDNDGADCRQLKRRLRELCERSGRPDTLVRIACQELEAWYLGDPEALARAFASPHLREIGNKARFRDPDAVDQPSSALARLVPEFQKVSGARRMAAVMSLDNRSRSFQIFVDGVGRLRQP